MEVKRPAELVASVLPEADPYQDFADFVNSMGLTIDWDPLFDQMPAATEQAEPTTHRNDSSNEGTGTATMNAALAPVAANHGENEARNAVSNVQSAATLPIPQEMKDVATAYRFDLDEEQMRLLHLSMSDYQQCVPNFALPSRHALTRYLNAYFDSFHPHLPFIHAPTFEVSTCNLELVLAIAAAGAQYRFEHQKSITLFFAAKSILQERIKRREMAPRDTIYAATPAEGSIPSENSPTFQSQDGHFFFGCREPDGQGTASKVCLMDDARCLLCLLVFSTWKFDPHVYRAALSMQSALVQCVREAGLADGNNEGDEVDWRRWARNESDKRTKFLAFCFLNIHSLAYNVPPLFLGNEIHLSLPSSSEEWAAITEEHWLAYRQPPPARQVIFSKALTLLLSSSSSPVCLKPNPSALGNYVLLHGLLQRIFLVRQAFHSIENSPSYLPSIELDSLENALRSWTLAWQQAPESSLDPQNISGPIPFTSTALLGLVYCRMSLDAGPYRVLASRDPHQIAQRLLEMPSVQRGPRLIHALLHATHSLNIPVKLGVEYVARSQGFFWSIQHALCSLEFAVLVSKWLYDLAGLHESQRLDKQETGIVEWIRQIVAEGRASIDQDQVEGSIESRSRSDYLELAYMVVRIWAVIMRGNVQWRMVNIIGQALELYANLCRSNLQLEDADI
ncbi:hypothetical protein A1O3_08908 [Capronia epimyces CBS 606.96]|uniref:Xylanolytic transcriptional activator regulatory domain-containing protein n=1 Tax=Capronia epimyces CBS 606.96 TaxID=1182542 RepID=W9XR24_9EURO|nr:uncharacterized protein A1O3_08908 [Capronia epimyces CBS 606.96]EXJ79406.1 hypothetical protein A1O3_08908 [Capronia epimyces CBS 606.96]